MMLLARSAGRLRLVGVRPVARSWIAARGAGSQTEAQADEVYERKTPVEHVLLRPGMYVGSMQAETRTMWLPSVGDAADQSLHPHEVEVIPALCKVFDEVLVNALDNARRDASMRRVEVRIRPGGVGAKAGGGGKGRGRGKSGGGGGGGNDGGPASFSVFNDGRGLPVRRHAHEDMYVPELVLGNLLTGSNFGDGDGSVTGGRHGYGAKLTNIFASRFTVETADTERGLYYRQEWRDNMGVREEPALRAYPLEEAVEPVPGAAMAVVAGVGARAGGRGMSAAMRKRDFTQVTVEPDLARFGLDPAGGLPPGCVAAMRKRVLEASACVGIGGRGVAVYLDGERVHCDGFDTFVGLHAHAHDESQAGAGHADSSGTDARGAGRVRPLCADAGPRWQIGVLPSCSGSFEQHSYVNGIWTPRGGTHVKHVADQICAAVAASLATPAARVRALGTALRLEAGGDAGGRGGGGGTAGVDELMREAAREARVTPAQVRPHLHLLVNCLVEEPSFDSQAKDELTTRSTDFGSACELSRAFIASVVRDSGVAQRVLLGAVRRRRAELEALVARGGSKLRAGGSSRGQAAAAALAAAYPKLDDAAGAASGDAARARECTLIVTEGDSAKALAVAGLAVVGRERYGVFPLRGKLLNVRDASARALAKNAEVAALRDIIGLSHDAHYDVGTPEGEAQRAGLRYGRIMVMADQDFDGSHIKGLLLNYFHFFWPRLLESGGFVQEFVTPLIKVTRTGRARTKPKSSTRAKAKKKGKAEGKAATQGKAEGNGDSGAAEQIAFFTTLEFEAWKEAVLAEAEAKAGASAAPPSLASLGWRVKYYKGLGTSTAAEARDYFADMPRHVLDFCWHDDDEDEDGAGGGAVGAGGLAVDGDGGGGDGPASAAERAAHMCDSSDAGVLLEMAFAKRCAAERRQWLLSSPAIGASFVATDGVLPSVPAGAGTRAGVGGVGGAAAGEDADEAREQEQERERGDERRRRLRSSVVDHSASSLSVSDFVKRELVHFSHHDVLRSIPSAVDGLKPSQRKVLFGCFKRKLTREVKVAQLAGYCAEHAGYHHGEASLHATIVNMAQDYVGANNLPLLEPIGQFGTRLQGGRDAASARYIFTRLAPLTRLVFPAADDVLLPPRDDDGMPVEPEFYVPILPVLLANGAEGIGTGWSTSVPRYNPLDIAECLLARLGLGGGDSVGDGDGEAEGVGFCELRPWTRGFSGTIAPRRAGGFVSTGTVERLSSTQLRISELPVGRWTTDYKEQVLAPMLAARALRGVEERHTESAVDFVLSMPRAALRELEDAEGGLQRALSLQSTIGTSNMHAFDPSSRIRRYDGPGGVLRDFFPVRLELYRRRREWLKARYTASSRRLSNRARFVGEVASGDFALFGADRAPRPHALLEAQLHERGYDDEAALARMRGAAEADHGEDAGSETGAFDYLLGMRLMGFTEERSHALHAACEAEERALDGVHRTSAEEMWRQELEKLRDELAADETFLRNRDFDLTRRCDKA